MSNSEKIVTKAYVVAELGGPFELRDVRLDDLQPDELLVEMKYTGVCHTVCYPGRDVATWLAHFCLRHKFTCIVGSRCSARWHAHWVVSSRAWP